MGHHRPHGRLRDSSTLKSIERTDADRRARTRRPRAVLNAPERLEDRTLLSFAGLAGILDGDLATLQAGVTSVLDHTAPVPLVGPVAGDSPGAQFINALRPQLQTAIASLDAFVPAGGPNVAQIQAALFAALGNGPGGLGLIADHDGNGVSPTDVVVTPLATGGFDVAMHLHQDAPVAGTPVAFNLGLSGLPFQVGVATTGSVGVAIGFDYELAFHFDAAATTIALDPAAKLSDITPNAPASTMAVAVNASVSSNFSATATIGFVQGALTPLPSQVNTLGGTFAMDVDGQGNPTSPVLTGRAELNLELSGGISGASQFPSIGTDFQLLWTIDSSNPSGNVPTVSFSDVKLNLGSFLSGLLGPVVQDLDQLIGPNTALGEVLKVINTPIPGLSDLSELLGYNPVTIESLASIASDAVGLGPEVGLAIQLVDIASKLAAVQASGDGSNVFIDLGGFNLDGENLQGSTLGSLSDLSLANLTNLVANPDQALETLTKLENDLSLPPDVQAVIKALFPPTNGAGVDIQLPILEDPVDQGFGLLLGRDAQFITVHAYAHFQAQESTSLDKLSFYGFDFGYFGDVAVNADLTFGYDTHGLREIINQIAQGVPVDVASDISDGFYMNSGAEGVNGSYITLGGQFGITAGGSALIASVHIQGAIETGPGGNDPISISLKDDGSHKARLATFVNDLLLGGSLDAGLGINIQVGVNTPFGFVGYRHTFGIASVTLLDFHNGYKPPVLALASPPDANGVVTLYVGQALAHLRSVVGFGGAVVPNSGGDYGENYTIDHVGGTLGDESINVTDNVLQPDGSVISATQRIDHVSQIDCNADDGLTEHQSGPFTPTGDLTIDVQEGVLSSVDLSGGYGTAHLTYAGSGTASLTAGHGDSVLVGGSGPNTLTGLEGANTLVGGPNGALFQAGPGVNYIVVQGNNSLIGANPDPNLPPPVIRVEVIEAPRRLKEAPGTAPAAGIVTTTVNEPYLNATDLGALFKTDLGVSVTRPDGASVNFFGAGITDLILDGNGGLGNVVNIDDVSQTPLKTITMDLTAYYGFGTNKVTVAGSPGGDDFLVGRPFLGTGSLVTVESVLSAGVFLPHNTLSIHIVGVDGNDTLVLHSGGGVNTYDVNLHANIDTFGTVSIDDPSSSVAATIDGGALGAGSVLVQDADPAIRFDYKIDIGFGPVSQTRFVTFTNVVYDLTVVGSSQGESFVATRNIATFKTKLLGGPGDDTFRVSGNDTYVLDGRDGNDTYIVVFGLVSSNVTIASTGTMGSDTIEADDSTHVLSGDRGVDYTITPTSITRVTHATQNFGGFTKPGGSKNQDYVAAVQFDPSTYPNSGRKPFRWVTLDTGLQILAPTRIDIVGTAAGATTTINAYAGPLAANGAPAIIRLCPDNQDVDTNGPNGTQLVLNGPGMNLDTIAGPLVINGGRKDDSLEVFDQLDPNRIISQLSLSRTTLTHFDVTFYSGYVIVPHLVSVSYGNLKGVTLYAPGSLVTVDVSEANVYDNQVDLRAVNQPADIARSSSLAVRTSDVFQILNLSESTWVNVLDDGMRLLKVIERGGFADGPGAVTNTFDVLSNPTTFTTILDFEGSYGVVNVHLARGPLVITGGGGSDIVNLGDAGHVSGLAAPVSIAGANHNITLNVNDSADQTARYVTITSAAITGLAPRTIRYDQRALAALNINGSSGLTTKESFNGQIFHIPFGSTYNVLSTPDAGLNSGGSIDTTTTTITSNSLDFVNVGDRGSVQGVQGNLAIVSPLHSTFLNIDGSKDGTPFSRGRGSRGRFRALSKRGVIGRRYIMTAAGRQAARHTLPETARGGTHARFVNSRRFGSITPSLASPATAIIGGYFRPIIIDSTGVVGLAPGDITFAADGLTGLLVNTPQGGKTIDVWGTPNQGAVGSIVTSLIGHGRDTVYVGDGSGGLARVQGVLDIANPPSYTSLVVDGSSEPAKQNVTITPGRISGLAPADITYAPTDVNAIGLRGGTGGNTFHLVGGPVSNPFLGTVKRVPLSIDGGSGSNTLVGPDRVQTWNVTANDAGTVGNVTFQRIGGLAGGALADTFKLSDGATLSGRVDGGGGRNTLDMSAQSGDVGVDLPLGVATGIAGGVANINDVLGGQGLNILVGDAAANTLAGGAGRNLLIGGGGSDQVIGGAGENILIGGTTNFDLNLAALDALMSEFARPDEDFITRLTHLLSGDGANGSTLLNPTTVQASPQASVLTGGPGVNWFFVSDGKDTITPGTLRTGNVVTKI